MNEVLTNVEALTTAAMQLKGMMAANGDPLVSLLLIEDRRGVSVVPWPYSATQLEEYAGAMRVLDVRKAAFLSDSYGVMVMGDADIEREQASTESLPDRFANGDPSVYECLTLIVATRSGGQHYVQVPYDMADYGVPVYRDPINLDDAVVEGRIVDALRTIVTKVQRRQ